MSSNPLSKPLPLLYAALGVQGAGVAMSGLALPFLIDRFDVEKGVGGFIPAISALGFGLGSLVGGRLADTSGRKATVGYGVVLLAASSFGIALSPFYWIALSAAAAGGFGSGFMEAAGNTAVADISGPRAPRSLSILHFCFGAGAVIGPIVFAALLSLTGRWWVSLLTLGGAQILIVLWTRLSELPGRPEKRPRRWKPSFRFDTQLFLLATAMLLYVGIEFGFGQWEFAYLTQEHGVSDATASAAVSAFFAALATGRLLVAWLTKYLRVPVMLFGLMLATIATGASVPLAGASLASAAALGLACSGIFPLILALGSERFPGSAGTMGGIVAAGGMGAVVSPPAMGFVADWANLTTAMWLLPAMGVLMLTAMLFVRAPANPTRAPERKPENVAHPV